MQKYLTEEGIIKMPDLEYPWEFKSVGELLFKKIRSHGDNIFQIDAATGEKDTYKSLFQRTVRTAIWLQSQNITPQDIVCNCMDKDFNRFVPMVAAQYVGAIISTLYENVSLDNAMLTLKALKPKFIFVKEEKLRVIEEAVAKLNLHTKIIVSGKSDKYTEFEECLEEKEGEKDFEPTVIEDSRKTTLICFSSGSTGDPKPICLNHYALMRQMYKGQIHKDVDIEKAQNQAKRTTFPFVICNYSTLYGISGALAVFTTCLHGICTLVCKQFDVEEMWKYIDQYKVH